MRRATEIAAILEAQGIISIHALHEESDLLGGQKGDQGHGISIHALHEESDSPKNKAPPPNGISIHALHEESDKWSQNRV